MRKRMIGKFTWVSETLPAFEWGTKSKAKGWRNGVYRKTVSIRIEKENNRANIKQILHKVVENWRIEHSKDSIINKLGESKPLNETVNKTLRVMWLTKQHL